MSVFNESRNSPKEPLRTKLKCKNDHNLLFVFDFLLLTFDFTFAARPGGEIGRRTVFRWQHPKGCAGSNPVPGT